jgi:signal transduction histidine kinase
VLRNVISNSLTFTPAGGSVTVYVKMTEEVAVGDEAGEKYYEVAVTDTGVGISMVVLFAIFFIALNVKV